MNPAHRRKLSLVVVICAGVALAAFLALRAFQENLLYFYSPSQVTAGQAPAGRDFRIGGLVERGSVQRDGQTLAVSFVLTDTLNRVTVRYDGILPDLFREGQGIVANGRMAGSVFEAAQVLAKHDENYMPPEVARSLEEAGVKMPHYGPAEAQ